MAYRPLPYYLTIKKSKIDGLGLFSTEFIEKGITAGVTHYVDPITQQLYRTPLGGFINHSETPNAVIIDVQRYKYLKFLVDIEPNTEITVTYTLYNPINTDDKL